MTGSELRQLRKQLGLTQAQLARILGVQRVTVTRAENRKISRLLQSILNEAISSGKIKIANPP